MGLFNFKRETISAGGSSAATDVPVRIRVAHWNIGHLCNGRGTTSAITSANAETEAAKYTALINSIAPQVIGVCEYEGGFTSDGSEKTEDMVFSAFDRKITGTDYNWTWNALFMNGLTFVRSYEKAYTRRSTYQNYLVSVLTINGKTVYLVETHLDHNGNTDGAACRAAQITELITAFTNADYVIIMADFNSSSTSEYAAFTNAGYNVANSGYIGDIITYPSSSRSLDNIVTKGFQLIGIGASDESAELSDHKLIYADLIML